MSAPAASAVDVARIERAARIRGTLEVPGDKSISHRGAIMNAIAHGTATVDKYLPGADCLSTLDCLRALGVGVTFDPTGASGKPRVTVEGRGGLLSEAIRPLDCGNSGTTMRLMAGLLAGQPIFSVMTGDNSLSRPPRPWTVTRGLPPAPVGSYVIPTPSARRQSSVERQSAPGR